MANATDVQRHLRYAGPGCSHDLLLRATRPSYSNADVGAENAAHAFTESAFAHLTSWFEQWVLARDCSAEHGSETVGETDEPDLELEGPGFRWVDRGGVRTYFLTDAGADGDLRDT